MWIVRLALRRPYTFVVMAMLIVILGMVTILRMPTDIFPEIDIPVISVVWNYPGCPRRRWTSASSRNYERRSPRPSTTSSTSRARSLYGVAVVKIFFQPGAKIEAATAQVTAISQTVLRQMPPGTTPPLIMRYSASNVPILQLSLSSDTLPEQELFDLANNFLRTGLATVQGAQLPWPYGGKVRQIMVDLDPEQAATRSGLSPTDVSNARQRPEPDPPVGHGQDRRARVSRSGSTAAPTTVDGRSTICRSRPSTARPIYIRTSPTSATASRRRPASSTPDGKPRRAAIDPESRRRLARWTSWRASAPRCRRSCRTLPKELQINAAVRSVDLRARGGRGRGEGGGHRRGADRAHDPAVPGQLAQHADRRESRSRCRSWCRSSSWAPWARPSTS